MASQLAIELTLENPDGCIFVLNGTGSGATPTYAVGNVNLIPEILEFDASYDAMFLRGLREGGVPLKFSSWHTFIFSIGSTSNANFLINERSRSVKAVSFYFLLNLGSCSPSSVVHQSTEPPIHTLVSLTLQLLHPLVLPCKTISSVLVVGKPYVNISNLSDTFLQLPFNFPRRLDLPLAMAAQRLMSSWRRLLISLATTDSLPAATPTDGPSLQLPQPLPLVQVQPPLISPNLISVQTSPTFTFKMPAELVSPSTPMLPKPRPRPRATRLVETWGRAVMRLRSRLRRAMDWRSVG